MSITAVILSHNSLPTLVQVLAAIQAQSVRPARVVVVDNDSRDGTVDHLRQALDSTDTIFLPQNVGVGAGHNLGWRRAMSEGGCEFIWALEHDAIPTRTCLARLLDAAQGQSPRPAVAIPRQLLPEETPEDADRALAARGIPRSALTPRRLERMTLNGALISVAAIQEVGFLREDFFIGQEDREYALRLLQAGFSIIKHPDAFIVHRNKERARRGIRPGILRSYYGTRNRIFLHTHIAQKPFAAPRMVGRSLLTMLRSLALEDQRLARIQATYRATLDGLRGDLGRKEYPFLTSSVGRDGSGGRAGGQADQRSSS